jgi:hypothetical protein
MVHFKNVINPLKTKERERERERRNREGRGTLINIMGGLRKVYCSEISKECPLVLLLKVGWKQSRALVSEEG